MKRCVFGAEFIINGISDGTLYIHSSDIFSHIRSQYSNSKPFTADTPTYEAIYTFNDVYGCWQNPDTYSKELTLELSWERGNGITQELDPQKVVFKRNVLTTVTINLNGASSNASLGINEEGTPMGAENIHISIEAGDPTDNTVNPKN